MLFHRPLFIFLRENRNETGSHHARIVVETDRMLVYSNTGDWDHLSLRKLSKAVVALYYPIDLFTMGCLHRLVNVVGRATFKKDGEAGKIETLRTMDPDRLRGRNVNFPCVCLGIFWHYQRQLHLRTFDLFNNNLPGHIHPALPEKGK